MEHLCSKTINHRERDLGPVLRRIDMNTEGSLAEWRINDLHDCRRNRANIGVIGYDGRERFLDFLAIAFMWPAS